MSSKAKIVVGIDGTEASLAALRWAMREAVASDSVVDVVHAWHAHSARDVAFGSADSLERGSKAMLENEVAAALREMDDQPVVTQTSVHGRIGQVLVERSKGASMLVLGAHGTGSLREKVLGDPDNAIRKNARCTVVVINRDGSVKEKK